MNGRPRATALFAAALTVLAAPTIASAARPAAPASCSAQASSTWVAGGVRMAVQARADGPRCSQAVATLVVRAADGRPLHVFAAPTADLFGLSDAATPAALRAGLAEWIAPDRPTTTATLPVWPAGESEPTQGEFSIYPADGVDRDAWTRIRAARLPMFCFIQGRESLKCLARDRGDLIEVGLQTFPG